MINGCVIELIRMHCSTPLCSRGDFSAAGATGGGSVCWALAPVTSVDPPVARLLPVDRWCWCLDHCSASSFGPTTVPGAIGTRSSLSRPFGQAVAMAPVRSLFARLPLCLALLLCVCTALPVVLAAPPPLSAPLQSLLADAGQCTAPTQRIGAAQWPRRCDCGSCDCWRHPRRPPSPPAHASHCPTLSFVLPPSRCSLFFLPSDCARADERHLTRPRVCSLSVD